MDNIIEWIGYLASFIVLVSLLMSSIKKLRFINLAGSLIFAVYGFLIGSYPVMIMNAGIVMINLYYLKQIYTSKDFFKLIELSSNDSYAEAFIDFNKQNIREYMPLKDDALKESTYRLLIARNMVPAGLFLAKKLDENVLQVTLDYATPQYQDFQTGAFIYEQNLDHFKKDGFKFLVTFTDDLKHEKYLLKMGFEASTYHNKKAFIKTL